MALGNTVETIQKEELFSLKELFAKFPELDTEFDRLPENLVLYFVAKGVIDAASDAIPLDDLATVDLIYEDDKPNQRKIYYTYTVIEEPDQGESEYEDVEVVEITERLFVIGQGIIQILDLNEVNQ